jgi:hypothetical protein|tara:strand:- start:71 stop:295 length:225 start_codon:yes stop_codon:yes gene_type:complete
MKNMKNDINIPNPNNDSDWITHAEHEARRGICDNFGNQVPSGHELDPVWGPINGAVRPVAKPYFQNGQVIWPKD